MVVLFLLTKITGLQADNLSNISRSIYNQTFWILGKLFPKQNKEQLLFYYVQQVWLYKDYQLHLIGWIIYQAYYFAN